MSAPDDPEGTETQSDYAIAKKKADAVANALGLPPTKNPEGVPDNKKGKKS